MTVLYFLDLLGTAAFAASGALAGVQRRMDLLGVVVLGLVTAVGGGTIRDVLLGAVPPFCFNDENYLYLSIVVALLVFYYHHSLDFLHRPLLYFDALGLGTFLVIGTGKALAYNHGFLVAVMMGVMTATAGGVVRDVLSDQVPFILQKEIYATACIFGGILYYILYRLGMNESLIAVIAALVVVIIRVVAIHRHWSLPIAKID
ncbi:MAG: trimeric intracellular cation channel family protein [Zetaproteobacteria bacterium]|nr:trimeric intracellular cation channel family protein [Zetaproteobacteria bacterium]MCK5352528.1 trimeric intracellular cation channel family protein [bacterium]